MAPNAPIADDRLLAARKELAPFVLIQLEAIGDAPGYILHQVVFALSHLFQEWKHDGLKVRYGHDRPLNS